MPQRQKPQFLLLRSFIFNSNVQTSTATIASPFACLQILQVRSASCRRKSVGCNLNLLKLTIFFRLLSSSVWVRPAVGEKEKDQCNFYGCFLFSVEFILQLQIRGQFIVISAWHLFVVSSSSASQIWKPTQRVHLSLSPFRLRIYLHRQRQSERASGLIAEEDRVGDRMAHSWRISTAWYSSRKSNITDIEGGPCPLALLSDFGLKYVYIGVHSSESIHSRRFLPSIGLMNAV